MDLDSISIVIPALDEEDRLEWSVRTVVSAARRAFDTFEILVFDDGSTDRTGEIADGLAAEIPEVVAFHHARPNGLGGVIARGLELARMRYFLWVDGKGATSEEALDRLFAARARADVVVLYAVNQTERPILRRVISTVFRELLNLAFPPRLRQHTHPALCETTLARSIPVRTRSFAYPAEALIKMIRAGSTWVEIGVRDDFSRQFEHTNAFRLTNVVGTAFFFFQLVYDIHLRPKRTTTYIRPKREPTPPPLSTSCPRD